MARVNRIAVEGIPHHVVNRGNDRRRVFSEAVDYRRFLDLSDIAVQQFGVQRLAFCLMPNHFHLVLQPDAGLALSAYMQWLTGCYSCYYRTRTRTLGHGHVFQRRFWSAPVHDELHFGAIVRYVEANPVRAGLVASAEEWPWSSIRLRLRGRLPIPGDLHSGEWRSLVNASQGRDTLTRLRREICPPPGRPFARAGEVVPRG